ncbi:MAG: F0F1 ATP synthase subunit B [Candidatus Levybacteria bacterium]|nr:F0F1 ATP synthase subunit B [Candidatus Levybacteria bacterium]
MEIVREFGVNPYLLFAQVVNFLIIFYVLKRFAYKPILQMLKNREETIKKSLKQAEETQKLLEETERKEREILKKAREEAKQMIEEAKKDQETLSQKAHEETRKQAEKMIQDARTQIALETKGVEKRLSTQVTRLAIDFLQKSLPEVLTGDEQEVVMKQALRKIKKQAD